MVLQFLEALLYMHAFNKLQQHLLSKNPFKRNMHVISQDAV